jgi:hypothetical protein
MASLLARRGLFFRALGIGALFTGVALLAHIIAGVSLRLALALTFGFLILTVCLVWRRTTGEERLRMVRRTLVGVVSGYSQLFRMICRSSFCPNWILRLTILLRRFIYLVFCSLVPVHPILW